MSDERTPNDSGRVVKFVPRRKSPPAFSDDTGLLPPNNASESGEADDYHHRMKTNLAALVVVVLLVWCGLWLAARMAEFRASQDCLAIGARGACGTITVPDRRR